MIRNLRLADLFTLANGFAGTGAVLALVRAARDGGGASGGGDPTFFWVAAALFPVAMVMDLLDGRIARMRASASPLGQELDSLADLISFGVAPATMAFVVGIDGGWDAAALTFFVACGLSRLARYNVTATEVARAGGPTAKVRYFEGFPIPSSLVLVALMVALRLVDRTGGRLPLGAWWLGPFRLHPLALLFVFHGCAMISKTLRIPKP
jgi:CDP-diacylglycerol--serine O-phosphatidyltransferase